MVPLNDLISLEPFFRQSPSPEGGYLLLGIQEGRPSPFRPSTSSRSLPGLPSSPSPLSSGSSTLENHSVLVPPATPVSLPLSAPPASRLSAKSASAEDLKGMWKVGNLYWEGHHNKKMFSPLSVTRREPVKLPFLEVTPTSVLERLRSQTPKQIVKDERGPFALWSSESIDLSRTAPPEFGGYRGLYIGKLRQRSASLNRSLNADKGYALLPNKYASGGVGSARANERRVLGSSPIKSPSRKLNSLQPLDTGDGYTAFPYAPSRASRIPPLKSPSKCSSVTKTLKTHHDLSYASFESNEDGTSDKSDIDEDVNEEEINEHREAIIKGSGHRTSATSEDLRNRNLSLEANEEATQPKTDQNVVAKNTVVLSAAQKEQQLEEDQPEEEEEEDVSDNREEQEQEDEEDFDENNYEIDLVEQARRFSLHGRNSYNHNGLTIRGGGRGSTNSLPISFGQQRGKNLFTKSNKNGPYFGSRNRKPIFKGRENHPDYFNYESDFESEDEDGKLDKRNNKNIARHDRRLTDREAREHRIRKYRELELRHSGNSLQITDPNQDPKIRFSRSRSSPRVSPQPVRKGVNISKSRSHDQNLNRKSRLDRERSHSSEKLNGYSKTVFSRSPSQDQRRLGRKTGSNPTIGFPSRYNDPVSSRRSTPGIGLDRGVARSTSVLSEENIPTAAFQNSNENYTAIQGRNFKPFPSAKDAFQSAMELLRGSDWEEQVDGIQSMARLAVFHPETLQRDLKEINAMLMKHAKNLRSQVSRAAIQAIMLFLDFLKKAMEQDLDKIVSLLLHKTSDTNKFIKEDTNTSLDMVVEVITPAKAVATIIQEGINHKNPLVRTTVARLLAYSCERIGSDKVLNQREVAEKMLPALTRLVQEGSLETRRYSKMAFQRLSFNKNFESTLKKNIPGDELRNIQKVLDSLQQSENRDVRENARYRDAKGGAAPRIRR